MAGITSLGSFSQTSSIDTLINQYLEVERKPVTKLETEKSDLTSLKTVYTDLKNKQKTLQTRVKSFTDVGLKATLGAKSVESSNSSVVTADVKATAKTGVNTIFVSRLAKYDTLVSDKISKNSTSLINSVKGETYSFNIVVGSEDTKEISVSIGDDVEDNEDILNKIADAINNAGIEVTAQVVDVNKNSARITITSNETGEENAITISGNTDLLQKIGFVENGKEDSRTAYSNAKGGYIEDDTENLDSLFTLNGLEITNSSNSIDNVLTGVTINLHSVQEESDSPETLIISSDTDTLQEEIESFITEYNDINSYLSSNSSVNTSTYSRGALAGDSTARNLKLNLRLATSESVSGLSGDINRLSQIGISFETDGTLKISDEDEFTEALENNAADVEQLFNSDEGIANKIDDLLQSYVTTGGIVDNTARSFSRKITNIDNRIDRYEDRLSARRESLRRQYANLQKTLTRLNSQQALLSRSLSNINNLNIGTSSYQLY